MEYLVTGIFDINSKKVRIQINFEEYIALYKAEIRKFHIEENCFIEEQIYKEIMNEILPGRARNRCLNLLSHRNMTELELRNKLRDGYYPSEVIDNTINLFVRNHLINDENYACNYVEVHQRNKSVRQIRQELTGKGINKETICRIMEENPVDEEQNIKKLLARKHFDGENATMEERTKLCGYLLRKGYDYDKIRRMVME